MHEVEWLNHPCILCNIHSKLTQRIHTTRMHRRRTFLGGRVEDSEVKIVSLTEVIGENDLLLEVEY